MVSATTRQQKPQHHHLLLLLLRSRSFLHLLSKNLIVIKRLCDCQLSATLILQRLVLTTRLLKRMPLLLLAVTMTESALYLNYY
jgi:hypothetical protein